MIYVWVPLRHGICMSSAIAWYLWVSLGYDICLISGRVWYLLVPLGYIYRLMHTLFHIRTVVIPRDRYRPEGFSPRVDIGRGIITVMIWKKSCYLSHNFNIELKKKKLTSHTKLWVIDTCIGLGMITVLIWKTACIVLFIKRLHIMLLYPLQTKFGGVYRNHSVRPSVHVPFKRNSS